MWRLRFPECAPIDLTHWNHISRSDETQKTSYDFPNREIDTFVIFLENESDFWYGSMFFIGGESFNIHVNLFSIQFLFPNIVYF